MLRSLPRPGLVRVAVTSTESAQDYSHHSAKPLLPLEFSSLRISNNYEIITNVMKFT